MYWENVEGWFTFQLLYSNMVQKFDNATFVEIGSWKGKSAIYMAEEIVKHKKNIKFYAVDLFEYSEEYKDQFIDTPDLYKEYLDNIEPVKNYITTIKGDSVEMSKEFNDNSIDFIFVDASHIYENVLKDLKHWYPKLKTGGIITGHDYSSPGVKNAVDQFFMFRAKSYIGDCWICNK